MSMFYIVGGRKNRQVHERQKEVRRMRNLIVSAPRMLALLGAVLFIGASAQASQTHKETGISAKAANQSYLLAEDENKQEDNSEDNSKEDSED
jgi:hypothetical protein